MMSKSLLQARVDEWIAQEKNYIESLDSLVSNYKIPLCSADEGGLLCLRTQRTIFRNKMTLLKIVEITETHLKHLEGPLLRFMVGADEANRVLSGLRHRCSAFESKCTELSRNSGGIAGRSLESMLIMPIQQSPRRWMLAKAVKKAAEKESVAHEREIEILVSVLQSFNKACDATIERRKICNVCRTIEWGDLVDKIESKELQQQLFGNTELACALIAEGKIYKLRKRGFSKEMSHIFLFEDVLAYTSGPDRTSAVADVLFLQHEKGATVFDARDARFSVRGLSIVRGGKPRTLIFEAHTGAEAVYWVNSLRKAISSTSKIPILGGGVTFVTGSVSPRRAKKGTRAVDDDDSVGDDSGFCSSTSEEDDSESAHKTSAGKTTSSSKSTLRFQFGAKHLRNRDGRGIAAFGISDPFYEILDTQYDQIIYRSEVIIDDLNPTWLPVSIDLEKVKGKILDIRVWDRDPHKNDYLGEVHTSWHELNSLQLGSKLELQDNETNHKFDKRSGHLVLKLWDVQRASTFGS
eukprot:g1616.t1